jgi:hypothetical protein
LSQTEIASYFIATLSRLPPQMLMFWSGRPQLRPLGLRRPTPISLFYPTIYSMRSSEDGKTESAKPSIVKSANQEVGKRDIALAARFL